MKPDRPPLRALARLSAKARRRREAQQRREFWARIRADLRPLRTHAHPHSHRRAS